MRVENSRCSVPNSSRLKTNSPLHTIHRGASNGFTLVELLTVMTIIVILTALTVWGYRGISTALSLSAASQAVTSELTMARQTALALNENVEIRFYQYPDCTGATTTVEYQAMQSFSSKDNGMSTPLDKITFFPPNIMISASSTYSSPLGSTTATPAVASDPAIQVNGVGHSYSYVSASFTSNGTLDPQVASWFVTVLEKKYAAGGSPVNFTTITVDPLNGRIHQFRP
jgi:uncharacterized protein (TIGR02596 family)